MSGRLKTFGFMLLGRNDKSVVGKDAASNEERVLRIATLLYK
jgi:hypothetical protein